MKSVKVNGQQMTSARWHGADVNRWRGTDDVMGDVSVSWGRRVGCVGFDIEALGGAWGHMRSPITTRLPPTCRSVQDDLSDTSRNVIRAIFMAVMIRAVVYAVKDSSTTVVAGPEPKTMAGRCRRFNSERLQWLLWWQKRCWEWSNTNKDKTAKKRLEQWLWYHVRNTK